MTAVRNILKSFLVGGLYYLMSFTVYQLCCATVDTFKGMMTYSGIYAVLFFFAGLFLVTVTLVTLFCMGAIPLALSNEIKEMKKEKEETE